MSPVQHINPTTLHENPTYTNVIVVSGSAKTVYIGAQGPQDASGATVGTDLSAQAKQVLKNVEAALAAGGAKLEHVVKWNVYILQGQRLGPAFSAFLEAWGLRTNLPTTTVLFVAGFPFPEYLVQMDAVAVVPDEPQRVTQTLRPESP